MEEGPTAGHLDGSGGSHGLGWGWCFFKPSEDAGHRKHKVVSEW